MGGQGPIGRAEIEIGASGDPVEKVLSDFERRFEGLEEHIKQAFEGGEQAVQAFQSSLEDAQRILQEIGQQEQLTLFEGFDAASAAAEAGFAAMSAALVEFNQDVARALETAERMEVFEEWARNVEEVREATAQLAAEEERLAAGMAAVEEGWQAWLEGAANVEKLTQEIAEFNEQTQAAGQHVEGVRQHVEAIHGLPVIHLFDPEEMEEINAILATMNEEAQGLFVAAIQEGKSVEEAFAAIRKVASDLSKELKSLESRKGLDPAIDQRIERLSARMRGLTGEVQNLDKGLQQAEQKAKNPLQAIAGYFDNLSEKIQEVTGFTEREFAVLLGAGLATGLAGVVRISNRIAGALTDFVQAERELLRQTELTFRGAAREVEDWADTTGHAMGLARREALETAIAFEGLARQLELPGVDPAQFAQTFGTLAGALEAVLPDDIEEITTKVKAAVEGSDEALRDLGVTTAEFAAISKREFDKLPDELSPAERVRVVIEALDEEAKQAAASGQAFRASFISQVIDPIRRAIATTDEGLEITLQRLKELKQVATGFTIPTAAGGRNLPIVGQLVGVLDRARATRDLRDALRDVGTEAELVILLNQALEEGERALAQAIQGEIERRRENIEAIAEETGASLKQIDVKEAGLQAIRNSKELQEQIIEVQKTYTRAVEDGERRITDALRRLEQVKEDNARRERDLLEKNRRAEIDNVRRVEEATISLAVARDRAADRMEDTAERITDAQQQMERSIRSIQERIEDRELQHSRRLEDLQLRKTRAMQQARRSITEALVGVQLAQIRGDLLAENAARRQLALQREQASQTNQIADIERDLAREMEDHAREIARLHRQLDEARLDGIERVRRATRDRDRAERDSIRDVERAQRSLNDAVRKQEEALRDAQRALEDLEIQANRALFEAKKRIEEAERARDRAVENAAKNLERLARSLGLVAEDLRAVIKEIRRARRLGIFSQDIPQSEIPVFQHGGPFSPNRPFIANEGGRGELIITKSGGVVISHKDFMRLIRRLEAMGSGGEGGITVNQYGQMPDEAAALRVSAMIARRVNN